ncbi:MAG: hypothetical protein JNK11_17855 [Alphaproteobacteria bacterium]|nr:hypothetical protein [Alphaproteobacteria bacterium]
MKIADVLAEAETRLAEADSLARMACHARDDAARKRAVAAAKASFQRYEELVAAARVMVRSEGDGGGKPGGKAGN